MARKPRPSLNMPYQLSTLATETAVIDRAAALAFFLLDNVQSVCGFWAGRMSAADQRALLGVYVGKGSIVISGEFETVDHSVSMCFGTMRESVWTKSWKELPA